MTKLYQRRGKGTFYWKRSYNGRRLKKSTRQTQKHLAVKIAAEWDRVMLRGDLSFMNLKSEQASTVADYVAHYLEHCASRQSEKTLATARGILKKLLVFLGEKKIVRLDQLTVSVLNEYVAWLTVAPKTIKNHVSVISRMLSLAVDEELISKNPAVKVKLPN